jgi:hypothetical protein
MHEVDSVAEGCGVTVEVELEGYDPYGATLVVEADTDFSGAIEEDERYVYSNAYYAFYYYHYLTSFRFSDDGPSPGNGTSSDNVVVNAYFAGDSESKTIEVRNQDPYFASHPSLLFSSNDDGENIAIVDVAISDKGRFDDHTVEVTWGDGTTTTVDAPYDEFSENYAVSKSVQVERVVSPGDDVFPLTVSVTDDDLGSVSYELDDAAATLNNDDDDADAETDLFDFDNPDEDDLVEIDLSSLPTGTLSDEDGTFYLNYNPSVVRLWTSEARTELVLPSYDDGYYWDDGNYVSDGNLWGFSEVNYTGQTTLFAEGIGLGQTWVQLSWQPDPSYEYCEQEGLHTVYGGGVRISVVGLDLDIDSDNSWTIDHSLWEEELEANRYGLGKLISPTDSSFTPVSLRTTTGLNPNDPMLEVEIDFDAVGHSGLVYLWDNPGGDGGAPPVLPSVADGGHRIYADDRYSLRTSTTTQ